jgi:hypothetical protein
MSQEKMLPVYLSGVEIPGVEKTKQDEMLHQMALNKNSMDLAGPYIQSKEFKRAIIISHENGERCFMNIEMAQLSSDEEDIVKGFPYKIIRNDIRTDSVNHAKLVQSTKLESYVKNYDKSYQIACVVWCRKPFACYTVLIMQPWKSLDSVKGLSK